MLYKTTWSHVQKAAKQGCGLCTLLILDKENHKDEVSFWLQFASVRPIPGFQDITPLHAQFLRIDVDGYEIEIDDNAWYVQTTNGMFPL